MTTTTEHVDSYGQTFEIPGPYTTLESAKRANRDSGHHFFDRDTLAFFRSRIAPGVIAGRLFVTSEQFVPSSGDPDKRRYTVRAILDDGRVHTVGTFQEFATLAAARRAANALATGAPVHPSLP